MTIQSLPLVAWCEDRQVYYLQDWDGTKWVERGTATQAQMNLWAYRADLLEEWSRTWPKYRYHEETADVT